MMGSWRADLKAIAQRVTGTAGADWRGNFQTLARFSGGAPSNYKEAVRIWAASHGVQSDNWRDGLMGISRQLVAVPPGSWREALRYIRLYYEGTPPQTLFLLNTLPAEPGAVYRWDDGAVWDDGLFWVEN